MQASDLSSDDKLANSTGYVSRKAANCSLAGRSRGVLGTRRPEKHSCKQCEQLSAIDICQVPACSRAWSTPDFVRPFCTGLCALVVSNRFPLIENSCRDLHVSEVMSGAVSCFNGRPPNGGFPASRLV